MGTTETSTDVAAPSTAPTTVAKVRKGTAATPAKGKGKQVAPYRVVTEHVHPAIVAAAKAAWVAGKRGTDLASAIAPVAQQHGKGGCTSGQATHYAMLAGCAAYRGQAVPLRTYGTDAKGAPRTPAALALAVVVMRNAGNSWVLPRTVYGITEPTCRAAYTAASGVPHASTGVGAWAWRGLPGQ